MIQMLIRIAITFQSTSPKASTSVMTPNQTIATTPTSAAIVPSTTLEMTATIAIAKIAMAVQANGSMLPLPELASSVRRSGGTSPGRSCFRARSCTPLLFLTSLRYFTSRIGRLDRCTTRVTVEPIRKSARAERPIVPITISSQPSFSASFTIVSASGPTSAWAS